MGAYDKKTIINPKSRPIEFQCQDEQGNTITCSGRIDFPGGMFFDTRVLQQPDSQVPFRYQVWRERARLNPCCWWQTEEPVVEDIEKLRFNRSSDGLPETFSFRSVTVPSGTFSVEVENLTLGKTEEIDYFDNNVMGGWEHEDVPSFAIDPKPESFKVVLINGATQIPTKCTLDKANTWNQGLDQTPPCNGAKTQCPYYTGPKYQYIEDTDLAPGQPILGQAVQELRNYIKNWKSFPNPQEKWEESFSLPYLWAFDKDNPSVLPQDVDFDTGPLDAIINLVKIYWDPVLEEAELSEVPSEPIGTENQSDPQLSPPDYPTLIGNLGESAAPLLTLSYPPKEFSNTENSAKPFTYNSFHNITHKMYLAGLSLGGTNIVIVNKNLIPDFIDPLGSTDSEITTAVSDFTFKYLNTNLKGFHITTSDSRRFWDLEEGLDLQPNTVNQIYILAQIEGIWSKLFLKVNYNFYHIDIFQEGFEANLGVPSSESILTSLANIPSETPLEFSIVPISNVCTVSNAYNVYTLDRSLSRLVRQDLNNNPKDRRYWGILQTKQSLSGNSLEGSIKWSKFDNCQRYLIEFLNGVPAAPVAGLKYGWEVKNIIFSFTDESGTQVDVEMEIDTDLTYSRSPKGEYLAHNFIIIKPVNFASFRIPEKTDLVKLDYYEFKADSSVVTDDFSEIILEHGPGILDADYLTQGYGGESLLPLSEDMDLSATLHEYDLNDSGIVFTQYSKNDLSYMLELTVPGFNNNKPIGRKWFVGVGENNKSWITDVEVRYAWSANEYTRPFEPFLYKGGPLNDPGAPDNLFINGATTRYPVCGDHEINPVGFGSLWFPYESCEQPEFRLNDEVLQVRLTIPNSLPVDEKYRGPDVKRPYTIRYNPTGFLNPCVWQYSLGTRYRSLANFVGYGRLRGPIAPQFDPVLYSSYLAFDWDFPTLGNRGRSAARAFRSMHFREYLYITAAGPRVALGWLPVYPHLSQRSLFEDGPRTIFENQVQDKSAVSLFLQDTKTVDGQKTLLEAAIEDESELTSTNVAEEILEFKRASFEQIYKVKRIRTPEGGGTRFPSSGFYFTFNNDSVVWAYRETPPDIVRKELTGAETIFSVLNRVTGINVNRPKLDNNIEVKDKFNRPVYLGVPEKEYTLTVEDITFNPSNGKIKEYAKVYINNQLPVYFDRRTGEILPAPNDDDRLGEIQPYALSNLTSLPFSVTPYFKPIGLENNAPRPTTASGLDTSLPTGVLFADSDIKYYYEDSVDSQGPIDTEATAFSTVGFIPSFNIENIIPTLLPKAEFCFDTDDFPNQLTPTINYNRYPISSIISASGLSGIELNSKTEEVFNCNENATGALLSELGTWKSDSSVDLTNGESGYTDPIVVTVTFKQAIELSSINFSYLVKVSDELETSLKLDPSIELTVVNDLTNENINLFSKPQITLTNSPTTSIVNDIGIPISEFEGLFINKIIIRVGRRNVACDFTLSKLRVNHYRIRQVSESIITLEPKYIPTLGYSTGDPSDLLHLPAQSNQYLTGTIGRPDISDQFESSGIAEFWQPGAASLHERDEVACKGKIRRHWAGGFNSFDVNRYFRGLNPSNTPDVFFTGTVQDVEIRQINVYNNMINDLKNLVNFLDFRLQYFINPFDLELIRNLGGNTPELEARYRILTERDIGEIARSDKAPLWQFEGFEVCPPTETRTTRCTVALGVYSIIGTAVVADIYNSETPDLCGPTGRLGNLDLLTLLQAPPPNNIAGGNIASVNTTGPQNINSFGDRVSTDADSLSLQLRLEEYLNKALEEEKKRYNP